MWIASGNPLGPIHSYFPCKIFQTRCVYRESEHKNSAAGVRDAGFDSVLPRTAIMSGWLGITLLNSLLAASFPKASLHSVHVGVENLSRSG